MREPKTSAEPTRNSICACSSGKKYKHCCGKSSPKPAANDDSDVAQRRYDEGNHWLRMGDAGRAVACYRAAIVARPNLYQAHGNLAVLLEQQDQLLDSLSAYQAARDHSAGTADAQATTANYRACTMHCQTWLLDLHRNEAMSPDRLAREHRRFAQLIARGLAAPHASHANSTDPTRRLRIGYVSPDFRRHSVAYFVEPVIRQHDRESVEVFCYYTGPPPDSLTDHFLSIADHWRAATTWSDDQLTECVRADAIDILVDLAGHTTGNRFLVFARKPAPVQITYLGYPGPTSLATMDHFLTDEIADSSDPARDGTEASLRLPRPLLAYHPAFGSHGLVRAAPLSVAPPPVLSNDFVTFGCFNNVAKMGSSVLNTWARILNAVPRSQLLLKSKDFDDPGRVSDWRERLSRHGLAGDRLRLLGRDDDDAAHLQRYADIDIALDTFPYNGVTTTFESLWMGVPVITLTGSNPASRMGLDIVTNLGVPEWASQSRLDYEAKAVALAGDRAQLISLRESLRGRLEASTLMDGGGLARCIEAAYRRAWQAWCRDHARVVSTVA